MFIFSPIRWGFRLVALVVYASVIYLVVTAVQVVLASRVSSDAVAATSANVIVSFIEPSSTVPLSADSTARLGQTLALFDAHKAPMVVVGGTGSAVTGASLSLAAESWLTSQSVPAGDIRRISASNNAGVLAQVASMFGHGSSVIVVTDAVDALWTRGAATSAGLNVQLSPPSSSKKAFYANFSPLWHEATGVALGRIVGDGRVTWATH